MRPAKGAPVGAPGWRNYKGNSPGHASILSGEAIHRPPFPENLPKLPPAGVQDHGTKTFTFSLFFSIIYVNTFTLREI